MALADLCINAVTLRKFTWTSVKGVRTPSAPTDTTTTASVQQARPDRVPVQLRAGGGATHVVYLAADPTVNVDDNILWGSRTLAVLAPAQDQAGRGEVWAVYCSELA